MKIKGGLYSLAQIRLTMKKAIILFCGALLLVGVSCQKQQASFATDEVKMTGPKQLVVNEDSAFTGELWDEDHRRCIEMKDGKKMKVILLHANGEKAVEFRYAHDNHEEEVLFYNENGREITQKEFAQQYRPLILQYGLN